MQLVFNDVLMKRLSLTASTLALSSSYGKERCFSSAALDFASQEKVGVDPVEYIQQLTPYAFGLAPAKTCRHAL